MAPDYVHRAPQGTTLSTVIAQRTTLTCQGCVKNVISGGHTAIEFKDRSSSQIWAGIEIDLS